MILVPRGRQPGDAYPQQTKFHFGPSHGSGRFVSLSRPSRLLTVLADNRVRRRSSRCWIRLRTKVAIQSLSRLPGMDVCRGLRSCFGGCPASFMTGC